MGKTALYLGFFCIYSAILLIIGKSSMHGSGTATDYFSCEKKVGLLPAVCSFTGTWISAITILSLTGSVYEDGLAVLCYSVVPWFLGAMLMGFLARSLNAGSAITVPEIFRLKYGSRALQCFYGAVLVFVYLFYLVTQYKGFGMVAAELFRIPYPAAVGLVYLFIMYSTVGGYRSVLHTDIFNLLLLTGSLLCMCAVLVTRAGGFAALYRQAAAITDPAVFAVPAASGSGQLLHLFNARYTPIVCFSMFWGWGIGLTVNPQYLVRIMSARDEKTAQRIIPVSLLILFVIYFTLVHIGLAMRVLVPVLPEGTTTDGILIQIVNNELYGPWSGFFFFAIIGACISTANSELLLIASSISYDLIRPLSREKISDDRVVNIARISVLCAGTIVMLLTLNPPDFTLSFGGNLWGIIAIFLFPPLFGGLLGDRLTLKGIYAGIAAGILSAAVLYPLHAAGRLTAHPAMYGVFLSSAAMLLVSAAGRRNSDAQEEKTNA